MESRPDHSHRSSQPQKTPFTEQADGKVHTLQKMIEKLLLISALLAIALLIILGLLIFGANADTLRLLLSGILESLISVLLIYIFRQPLFGSMEKIPLQKGELEQFGKVVDTQLEPIDQKLDAADAQLTSIVKQLKKREKEIVSIKKQIETLTSTLDKEYATLRIQVEQLENNMSLPRTR